LAVADRRPLPRPVRALIEENLRLSVDERFLQLMQLQRFASELRHGDRSRDAR
jgi:hypothetical protein